MCGRYVSPDQAAIERHWHIGRHNSNPFPARYNVAPQQGNPAAYIPIIRHADAGEFELALVQWWLLPHWSKDVKVKYSTFNARAESIATAPAFRTPFRQRRCLVPALGWYEWHTTPSGKQPWYMHAPDGELLHFAAVWDRWTRGTESIESCAIIVQEASAELAAVHTRMPVILPQERHAVWLDCKVTDADQVKACMHPASASRIAMHPVSTRVNSARINEPGLIDALSTNNT